MGCVSVSENMRKEEYQFMPPAVTNNCLNTDQWKTKIEEARANHRPHTDIVDEYELFVNYLIYFKLPSSFYIAIITRIIRHFVGDISSELLIEFNEKYKNGYSFDGVRITITTHPINGHIYISDDHKIYKLSKTNQLQIIAKIAQHSKQITKITDLTFNPDGTVLLCMINSDIDNIYYIDYDNKHKTIDEKIIYYNNVYDTMNILKYDFNNYYLKSLWFQQCLTGLIGTQIYGLDNVLYVDKCVNRSSTLYTINSYTNDLWILQNKNYLHKTEPILFRIPFHIANKLKHYTYEVEMIKLCDLCGLNNKYYGDQNNYILAFDVDKYYGGIYFITNDYILYRIEKVENVNKNKKYETYFNCKFSVYKWKVTHFVSLRKVLSYGLPLGLYTIKYDSVTGRIIIADNYKIQILYI